MNHFGRLAARVTRPNARQPGPALRSDSPIAEHDQRLTSFSVVPAFRRAHDAGDELEELAVAAQPELGPPSGAPGVPPSPARRTETAGESDGRSGVRAMVRPSLASASGAEPRRDPMATSTTSSSAASRPTPSAGIAEPPASGSRGAVGTGRLPADAPPSNAAQTVAALASAFARVQAWMAAPVAPRPSPLAGAPSAAAQIPEVTAPAGAETAARPFATPRPPHALAAPVPATTFADGRNARGELPSLSPSAAAAHQPSRGLEIGHLSVEVVPPPASPPVSREPAARRPQRPEVRGFENSAPRRGTVVRLGFGMRHW
jgi:hypothetical protein